MPTTKKKEELLEQPAQSSTVQQAQSALQQASNSGYQSKWQPQINTMMDQYMNRDKFSYDVNEDALFQQLKDQYAMMGQRAMMDTMGQASALTGGYGNSYAQGVGQQAYQGYMQQLADRVPDFYQMALNQYMYEGSQMRDNISMLMQQENVDYGQYRDLVSDQQWRETFDYSKSRDQLSDQQNAYSKLMALMTGYGYKPSDAEMSAAGMSTNQRDAILRKGAYAPVVYEEEVVSGGGSGGGGGTYDTHGLTEDEILELQRRNGISDDGIWGAQTEAAYQKEVAELERKEINRQQNLYNYLKNAENNW